MAEELTQELRGISGATYPEIFNKFRNLAAQYGDLPMSSLISAYNAAGGTLGFGSMYTPDPYVQNRRVKGIATRPADYSKDEVAAFVQKPDSSERQLRAVEAGLEYTAYPMFHTRVVYQNLLTYHSYVAPHLCDREDTKRDDFWREWKLCEKLRCAVNPKDKAHEFAGRALKEGKIFVVPRVSVDKAHNSVNHAFLQRLPSDWVKIVGYNNISKYTVAFDLMYFAKYGTDWRQFGDLFEPYINDWLGALTPAPMIRSKKIVYAAKSGLDLNALRKQADDRVDAYYQNGRWFYWVTLPIDRVFPMEIDDTDDNVLPPFVGLFLDLIQLSQMEQIQLEILQNPLVSILHGEMETWDERHNNTADEYKISDAGRRFFMALWYQMLAETNTGGIGLYVAPFKNMKLESLDEAPNAINIVSQGYTDTMAKAGLTALIPVSDEARAGAVNVSLAIESRMPETIYTCFERMMNAVMSKLNLTYSWVFHMFGNLSEDERRIKELKEEMTLGILSATIEYNAMRDRSILDDIAWSDAVLSSDLMNRRLPLVTSYNAKQSESGLPPQGGRPASDGVTSDGQEQDADGGTDV